MKYTINSYNYTCSRSNLVAKKKMFKNINESKNKNKEKIKIKINEVFE